MWAMQQGWSAEQFPRLIGQRGRGRSSSGWIFASRVECSRTYRRHQASTDNQHDSLPSQEDYIPPHCQPQMACSSCSKSFGVDGYRESMRCSRIQAETRHLLKTPRRTRVRTRHQSLPAGNRVSLFQTTGAFEAYKSAALRLGRRRRNDGVRRKCLWSLNGLRQAVGLE